MNRIRTQDTAERIGRALRLVPERILERMGPPDFFEGDAALAGLCPGGTFTSRWHDGQRERVQTFDYRDSAYFLRAHGQPVPRARRSPTVVLPQRWCGGRDRYPSVKVILHEMGHALQRQLSGQNDGHEERRRVLWDPKRREVIEWYSFGLFPNMARAGFTTYEPDSYDEQFAEAFAIWLHPTLHQGRELAATWFYREDPDMVTMGGQPASNRCVLAFFNELAGLPSDTPPVALR